MVYIMGDMINDVSCFHVNTKTAILNKIIWMSKCSQTWARGTQDPDIWFTTNLKNDSMIPYGRYNKNQNFATPRRPEDLL